MSTTIIRHALIFIATFALGALIALMVRSAHHQPYAAHPAEQPAAALPSPGHAPAPVPAVAPMAVAGDPVNTICPVCAMPVRPALGTALYQGKVVGFGCAVCLPKFAAAPERFGPAALRNQSLEE